MRTKLTEVLAGAGTGEALELSVTTHAGQHIEKGTFVKADRLGSAGAID